MSAEAVQTQAESAGHPGRTVTVHFPCAGCGHDLFTASLDAACPECGRSVREGLPGGERISFFVLDALNVKKEMRDATLKITVTVFLLCIIPTIAFMVLVGVGVGIIFGIAIALFQAFLNARQLRSHRQNLTGWVLILGFDELLCRFPGNRDVRIRRNEASGISERPNVGVAVYGANTRHRIEAPEGIAAYEALRTQLQEWAPARHYHSEWRELGLVVIRFSIVCIGVLLALFTSLLFALLGLVLTLAGTVWVSWWILRSPTISRKRARVMVALTIAGLMWTAYSFVSRF
ncbi:MAG: hypothetical protein NTW19_17375 [Planctomycetota bacterium]|nr:hypothetical protein [Planctomycetota bacterium]